MNVKPVIGILLGDSTGIGPELVAKTAAVGLLTKICRPVIIGDLRVFENALRVVGMKTEYYAIEKAGDADWSRGIPVLDQKDQDPAAIEMGKPSADCGRAVNAMLKLASELCKSGKLEGFAFAPLHKSAMIEAGCQFESEHSMLADIFDVKGPCGEINVLGQLMTTRATSHIPISQVSQNLTPERILEAISLSDMSAKSAGIEKPRIGIAALNPHCGESGRCGREEIDVISPAVRQAREAGIDAAGPFSADILFIRAFRGDFDSVVTMYHDQGQIALKLKGFEQGVTVAGGMPYPIATCAHGTAHDIAGKGIASASAFENAVKMVVKMARTASGQS